MLHGYKPYESTAMVGEAKSEGSESSTSTSTSDMGTVNVPFFSKMDPRQTYLVSGGDPDGLAIAHTP